MQRCRHRINSHLFHFPTSNESRACIRINHNKTGAIESPAALFAGRWRPHEPPTGQNKRCAAASMHAPCHHASSVVRQPSRTPSAPSSTHNAGPELRHDSHGRRNAPPAPPSEARAEPYQHHTRSKQSRFTQCAARLGISKTAAATHAGPEQFHANRAHTTATPPGIPICKPRTTYGG